VKQESPMMLVGYARTSTTEQVAGFEAQQRDLNGIGCEKLFSEQVSSVAQREQLNACLDFIREGDTLVVTKLDRLARSMRDLMDIVGLIKDKNAHLRILDMQLDTSTATGTLMLNLLGSVAEFERSMMLERQAEGVAKAKAEGKYKGRVPTALRQTDDVVAMAAQGSTPAEIVAQMRISRSSVYRIMKTNEATIEQQLRDRPSPMNL
jgi:DNA invertase Pin-like site-specific DNA recombinase